MLWLFFVCIGVLEMTAGGMGYGLTYDFGNYDFSVLTEFLY